MNNTINEIAASICRPYGDCMKCEVLITATEIYTAHVKPLEDALEKSHAQNAATLTEQAANLLQGLATGITGDAESFRIRMCITCPHCGLVANSVEEATAHDAVCEKHPAVIRAMKAEADKAMLVEALEEMVSVAEAIAVWESTPEKADGPLSKPISAPYSAREGGSMSEGKYYGLTINEQAYAMWITCCFNTNPEICTAHIIGGLEAKCPFDCKCDDVNREMWAEFLKQREIICPKSRIEILEASLLKEQAAFDAAQLSAEEECRCITQR